MGAPVEKLHAVDNREDLLFLIRAFLKYSASDMHLRPNRPPLYRINGRILPASMPNLSAAQIERILGPFIPSTLADALQTKRQIDFSFEVEEFGRFRCNIFYSMNRLSAAIRRIPFDIPSMDVLRVPAILKSILEKPRGLLLVTGSTGSGKSTTMASLVQHLNDTQRSHIVTIEDPIEYVFKDHKSVITQRELGSDFPTMHEALSSCMRQDPDVIVVGEMRDYTTIQTAITAAETGHLVISTLHTNDARSALDRILDMFPGDHKNQIRVQLASSLLGIVAQQLLTRADGKGRILASEVLIKSPSVEHAIRTNQLEQINDIMNKSDLYYKMHTMNMDLDHLIRDGHISFDEGLSASANPDDLRLRLSGIDRKEGYDYAVQQNEDPTHGNGSPQDE
ncbi:MAG: PilT/PilU family type 4a pilus ATPase [Cryobacterium sp.]|nr:PilT/PilU family type 4a pilus ATPase [Oligoflexia bacterium]